MEYLCPKCGAFLLCTCITTHPSKTYYKCPRCGYMSKMLSDTLYIELPEELWSEEEDEV